MKIKVKLKKRINERLGLSPTSDVNIEQLFRDLGVAKDSLESIFQKSLLFYDLETTGLQRKPKDGQLGDMIHQIAILKYTPSGDPDSLNPESPDDAYIAKIKIPEEYDLSLIHI